MSPRQTSLPISRNRHRRGFASVALLCHLGTLVWTLPLVLPKPVPPVTAPLPVSIAIAADDSKAVQNDAWIDAQLARAERLFGDAGVHFTKQSSRALDAKFARLENRADRDALAGELKKGVLNVFVVASLRDVDDPKLLRMGVHWRATSDLKKTYVILAASAQPTTMAHEFGHYFGLPHTFVQDNLMSYKRSGAGVFLDAGQKTTIATNAVHYVRKKQLVP